MRYWLEVRRGRSIDVPLVLGIKIALLPDYSYSGTAIHNVNLLVHDYNIMTYIKKDDEVLKVTLYH